MAISQSTRRTLVMLCSLFLTGAGQGSEAEHDEPRGTQITIRNLADDFVAVYDETATLAPHERRARFELEIASRFSHFYKPSSADAASQKAYEERLDQAFIDFPEYREGYEKKMGRFAGEIERNIESFATYFEDFPVEIEVQVLHSLGTMDGGTRTFDGNYYLIFGIDLMTRYHDFGNETPFFHHELFHFYQNEFVPEDGCTRLWCHVWIEGLAVYASRTLNPQATDEELLLAIPPELVTATQARLHEALVELRSAAFSEEEADYGRFLSFRSDDTGLPARRGYYLGLLIAEKLAETHDLRDLAHMSFDEVQPHFVEALDQLIEKAR